LEPKLYATEDYQDKYGVTSAVAQACLACCRSLIFQSQAQQKQFQSLEPTLRRQSAEPFQVNLIPNPVDANRFSLGAAHPLRKGVLWVGRADRFHKRPLLAIEIAKLCPEVPFRFVLNAGETDVRKQVEKELPNNVRLIDFVPNESMPERMRESRIFLSTGSPEFEGFPNVLLEAAASGTPIVSLEDFDGFLAKSGAGKAHGGDVHQASETLKRWYESETEWNPRSADGCQYVKKFHSLDAISAEFTQLAKKTVSATR
jgi:glycosyltransferase involved in cell wall biosynthesis